MFKWIGDTERAELLDLEPLWKPAERYSLAERADANSKFQDVPFRSRMALIGQFSPADIAEMEVERAGEQLLMQALLQPEQEPAVQAESEQVVNSFRNLSNGDIVEFAEGVGQVEHMMIGGVLGLEGSDFAIEATASNPAIQIRLWERVAGQWQATNAVYGARFTDVTRLSELPA